MLHIVLFEPEIAANTGNIARTCACLQAHLHLVEPMGFRLTDKHLKRAGLDYWDKLEITRHACTQAFLEAHAQDQLLFFTGHTNQSYFDISVDTKKDCYLIFGRESRGIDPEILEVYKTQCVRLPMAPGLRSLNLSNAVAIASYEFCRREGFTQLS